jgi:hypothetical protein
MIVTRRTDGCLKARKNEHGSERGRHGFEFRVRGQSERVQEQRLRLTSSGAFVFTDFGLESLFCIKSARLRTS